MPTNGPYHSSLFGPGPTSFRELFELRWREHLSSFPQKYRAGEQLRLGSRFRPLLVSWGYLLSGDDFDETARGELADVAVYVELLHKATLLIDDLIDDDDARHGREAFHIQFGDHDAILFAIYLLGDSVEKLSSSASRRFTDGHHAEIVDLLSGTIKELALGALEELSLAGEQFASIPKIKQIIGLQTVSIVKNGLLVGYKYGSGNPRADAAIASLGHDTGYLFQALNDLEPFLGELQNAEYKGARNSDVARSRKNMAVAFLFNQLSAGERRQFDTLRAAADPRLEAKLREWFEKYRIDEYAAENLGLVKRNVERTIRGLPVDRERRNGFSAFVGYVLSRALSRLDSARTQKLSEILIT